MGEPYRQTRCIRINHIAALFSKMIKNPPHRPEYEVTASGKATVQNLAAMGVSQEEIAECLGITRPTLRKHFKRELAVSRTEVHAMAMASIVKGLKNGDAWATTFYLKCRANWTETQAHRLVDKNGEDRSLLSELDEAVAAAES
jgi:DNA-binding CsgD family transcriptional regulator